jgi:ribonuclease Z
LFQRRCSLSSGPVERLGSLRDLLTVTVGQKIAYVTDVADTLANRAAIVALVQNADILFIEAAFAGFPAITPAAVVVRWARSLANAASAPAMCAASNRFTSLRAMLEKQERMLAEVMTAFQGSHA